MPSPARDHLGSSQAPLITMRCFAVPDKGACEGARVLSQSVMGVTEWSQIPL